MQHIKEFLLKNRPIGDRVIVIPEKKTKETKNGIATGDVGQGEDKRVFGEVMAVGPGNVSDSGSLIPTVIKVGDRVLFSKYVGEDILIDENLVLEKYNGIVRDDQVLFTIVHENVLLSILPD